jgi:hypothetical protein
MDTFCFGFELEGKEKGISLHRSKGSLNENIISSD